MKRMALCHQGLAPTPSLASLDSPRLPRPASRRSERLASSKSRCFGSALLRSVHYHAKLLIGCPL